MFNLALTLILAKDGGRTTAACLTRLRQRFANYIRTVIPCSTDSGRGLVGPVPYVLTAIAAASAALALSNPSAFAYCAAAIINALAGALRGRAHCCFVQ